MTSSTDYLNDVTTPSYLVNYLNMTSGNFTLPTNSSTDSPTTMQHTLLYSMLRNITNTLDMFMVPSLVAIGVIGNTLSFITFTCSTLKTLSSSVYLAALAVADTGFLFCVFASWITNFNINVYHQPGWCQVFVYLTYVFSFLSVWYVVGFTVERYIAVRFPFKRGDMCTVGRARVVVIALAIFSLVAYNFAIWTSGSFIMPSGSPIAGQRLCYPIDWWREVLKIANNIDSAVTLAIPFIVIAILNAHIMYAVARYRRQANQLVIYRRRTPSSSQNASTSTSNSNSNDSNKVTTMLLVVSFTFLLLNVPGHVIRIDVYIRTIQDPNYIPGVIYYELQKLSLYLYYLNFSINFLLYSLCGNNFRMALRSLLFRCCTTDEVTGKTVFRLWSTRNNRDLQSTVTKTSYHPDVHSTLL